jgi:transcriptional regulator with XRE-family HTH domain
MNIQDLQASVGRRIKMLREGLGMSQETLAGPFKSSKSYICDVEAGKKNATLDTLLKIADMLGVEVRAFFV